jgi:lipoprotein-anchoring transpeptidase ErfK/SrfK
MRYIAYVSCIFSLVLSSCSTYTSHPSSTQPAQAKNETTTSPPPDYASRIPSSIKTHEKVIVIDPNVHVWGAYNSNGELIRAGLATAGSDWCPDIKRRCHTKAGSFRIASLGSPSCKSSIYPLPHGGAPMPYCMFFNGNQGLHGSPSSVVVEGNLSHGCVRLHIPDAQWIRYNFANVGTKVIVKPY